MTTAPETWRPIPSEPGYSASDQGRIRNDATGTVLGQYGDGRGYLKTTLGHARQRRVHRLVCEAWHGAPDLRSDHVDHLNFDRAPHRPDNLRWLAAHLNIKRQVRWGAHGWEMEGDEPPEGYTPLADAEREAIDQELAASGW